MPRTNRNPKVVPIAPPPGPGTALGRGLADLRRETDAPRPLRTPPEAIVAEIALRDADAATAALEADNARLRAELADRDAVIRGLEAELERAGERAADAARAARVEAHRTAKHGGRLPSILALGD